MPFCLHKTSGKSVRFLLENFPAWLILFGTLKIHHLVRKLGSLRDRQVIKPDEQRVILRHRLTDERGACRALDHRHEQVCKALLSCTR